MKTPGFTTRTSALLTNIAWYRLLSPGVHDIVAELAVMSYTRRSNGAGITSRGDKFCFKYTTLLNTHHIVRMNEQMDHK